MPIPAPRTARLRPIRPRVLLPVAALTMPSVALAHGGEGLSAAEAWTAWNLTPEISGPILLILAVYLRGAWRRRSVTGPVPALRHVLFGGGILALFLSGISLNIYSQIGLVMLIGLMAKNGILIVEFADQLRHQGRTIREAVEEAAAIRLRPIAMTLISTVVGAVPLILASGAGAEARQSIGWVIFGGLGIAGVFTLFLTPVIYLGVARFGKPRSVDLAKLQEEIDDIDEDMTMAPA